MLLSRLESADHSDRPEMLPLRRPFLLTGSCLLYRGALACSHLAPSDQRAVAMYCYAYRLLELTATESVSQIVIWKEVCMLVKNQLVFPGVYVAHNPPSPPGGAISWFYRSTCVQARMRWRLEGE